MSGAGSENRDQNREQVPPRYAVSPVNGARIPLGAHPANTGGKRGRSGRRRDEMIEMLSRTMERDGIPLLRKIVRGKLAGVSIADRQRAVEMIARYVLDKRTQDVIAAAEVRARWSSTLDEVRALLPPELAQALVDRIRPHW